MPPTVRPRGPLPSRVYWTRRLIVLGVPLLLVVVLARVLGGSSDGQDGAADRAAQAGATVETEPTPTSGPTARATGKAKDKGKKNKKNKKNKQAEEQQTSPPEPVPAEPSGPCTESDVIATPTITSAAGGSDIPITINLRTAVTEACTWQPSPQTLTVTITSGDDYIWSSRECPASIAVQDLVVRQAAEVPVVVTWSAKRSDDGCTDRTEWAKPGFYHVEAAALGGEATDVQFELVAPSAPVVTKTADPQPQGKKGKSNKQGDTSHTPGEDGSGNSDG